MQINYIYDCYSKRVLSELFLDEAIDMDRSSEQNINIKKILEETQNLYKR